MKIYAVKIDQNFAENLIRELMPYVSREKQEKIGRFRKPIDSLRSLLGDLIIRLLLCSHYGFQNEKISYEYGQYGKPFLSESPHLHFNISHSGNWVIGVVAEHKVGIDIEKITDMKPELCSLAFTEKENEMLQKLSPQERKKMFFELWTVKESYIKATGKGLSEGLNTLEVMKERDLIRIQKDGKNTTSYFETFEMIGGYMISLCSFSLIFNKNIELTTLDSFMNQVQSIFKPTIFKV
ncbi:4'-phosphopantetheinyl transferase superfamily protein [Chryseobacterium sp. MYb264]|uniref:4'-phosphopantetheinyl transferase family protein n=1 Tax=Chryseobacterium sp. MYb264 TaxID=2745153 RepID=UPI002E15815D|nr:4'-phosphopantetheinyl transferase superfamily protein [Chryseobacterium sp. MYb264]